MSDDELNHDDRIMAEGGEVRWIESEAMREQDRLERQRRLQRPTGHNNKVQEDDDDDDVEGFADLFADPDPLDTFFFRFELPRVDTDSAVNSDDNDSNNKNNTSNTSNSHHTNVVEITLTGHKAELGQTLNSTGLTLWRASEYLCEFLVSAQESIHIHNPEESSTTTTITNAVRLATSVRGKDVLELGAGLGLCGILVHHMGAKRVILTDGDTDTLANLRVNVNANCQVNQREPANPSNSVECRQLVWGKNLPDFVHDHGQMDIVIGADIIYIPDILDPLWQSVTALLKPKAGVFLLAYARRNVSIDLVLDSATKYGFIWETPQQAEGVYIFSKLDGCTNTGDS